MRNLELQLQNEFPMFRRIWVQRAMIRGRLTVCFTLFPSGNENYRMVFGECPIVNLANLRNILATNLV